MKYMKPEGQDQQENLQETDVKQTLIKAAEGLLYPSESDYPFTYFEWDAANKETLAEKDVLQLVGKPATTQVKVLSLDSFFENVTQIQDWYGEEEKANTERFIQLKETLEKYLSGIQVFKTGEIEIEAYIAGKKKDGKWAGLSTMVVET